MEKTRKQHGITSINLGTMMEKARAEAAYQGLSLSAFIRRLIANWLQQRDEIEQLTSEEDA